MCIYNIYSITRNAGYEDSRLCLFRQNTNKLKIVHFYFYLHYNL
jgi:hypothetical protein